MPLWPGYRSAIEAEIADLRNDPAAWAQAGSVTAALFLQRFAPTTGAWAHMDIFRLEPARAARLAGGQRGAGHKGVLRYAVAALRGRLRRTERQGR
jgi:Leucyl aminopeptidase